MGKRRSLDDEEEDDDEAEEREIHEMEREIGEIGRKVIEARRKIPERIIEAFSSRIVALRPDIRLQTLIGVDSCSTATPSELQSSSESTEGSLSVGTNQEMLEKFRAKTTSNIAAMPKILQRANECIAKIEKLEQYNVDIDSVFKRKLK